MPQRGPILIIDDDLDDQEVLGEVFQSLALANKLKFFNLCDDALQYLQTTPEQPFLIFCDVNLPKMTGLELKEKINQNEDLRRKSIPFVFFTTSAARATINEAYQTTVQGYFQKPSKLEDLKRKIRLIVEYWSECLHPNQTMVE